MKAERYVCGALSAILTQYQLSFSSSTSTSVDPPASILIRLSAHSFSSSVRKPAAAGVSGMEKKHTMPKTAVTAPSTSFLISYTTVSRYRYTRGTH
jgi:hypothetical protein